MAFAGLGISLIGVFFCCLKVPVLMLLSLPMAAVGLLLSIMSLCKEKSIFNIVSTVICAVATIYIAVIWVIGINTIITYLNNPNFPEWPKKK